MQQLLVACLEVLLLEGGTEETPAMPRESVLACLDSALPLCKMYLSSFKVQSKQLQLGVACSESITCSHTR